MNNRIDIYPSIWRIISIILAGSLLVIGCYLMTIHPHASIEKFIGYFGIVFFSLAVIVGFVWLILRIMRKPLAIVYDNRLEYLIPLKMKYEIIPFLYVEMFVTVKEGAKLIRADYLTGSSKNTGIMNTLVPVEKICDILNERLEDFWAQPMLSQLLNRASVTKNLLTMGIDPRRFDFDTTSKPDCIVVMRDENRYKLVYVDFRGDSETLSNHLTENDACHAMLDNFLEEEIFKSKHGIK